MKDAGVVVWLVVVWLVLIFLTVVVGFEGVIERLDVLIEQTQTWEEFCTENPFECEELM